MVLPFIETGGTEEGKVLRSGIKSFVFVTFRMLVGHSGRDTKQIVEYVSLRAQNV